MFPAFFPFFFLTGLCGFAQTVMPLDFALHVPTVQATVEGRPATMVVDTAASITVLDSAFADGLSGSNRSTVQVKGAGQEAKARRLDRVRLSHRGEQVIEVPAIAISLESLSRQMGRRIDGIIGAHFLERFIVEFDYQRKVARLHGSAGYKHPADWKVISIRLDEGRPMVEGSLIGDRSTHKGNFVLDTASNHALTLLPAFAQRHMLPPRGAPVLEDPSVGIAGPSPAVVFPMKGFQLGDLHFARPYVRVRTVGRGDSRGLIGGAMLRQLRFAIDYPGKRLFYQQSEEFGRLFTLELAGVRVHWDGADYSQGRVMDVLPGRAGAKAGLLAGDEIVEPRLSPNQLAELVRKPNSKLLLGVKRAGQRITVELQLEPLLAVE